MNTGPAGFHQIETVSGPWGYEDYVELYSNVNWEIIGLENGWFEQAFWSKYRVVRILSNICDRSVVGDDRTNVLGEVPYRCLLWCRAWAKPLKGRSNGKCKDLPTVWSTVQLVL